MYRTPLLATYIVAELVIATVFCLGSIPGLDYAFNLTELPLQYRAEVFLLASLYGACAILYERFCVPHVSDDEGACLPASLSASVSGGLLVWVGLRHVACLSGSRDAHRSRPQPKPQSPSRPRWWAPSRASRARARRRPRRGPSRPSPGACACVFMWGGGAQAHESDRR